MEDCPFKSPEELFFRFNGDTSPKGAARVLRGYLTTGKTEW